MSVLKKRVDALERKVAVDEAEPIENPEPIGIFLKCTPEDLVSVYDHLLCPTSEWHSLSSKEKLLVVNEACFESYYELENDDDLVEPLINCGLAVIRCIKRVRKLTGEVAGEEYAKALEEDWARLNGTV